MNTLPRWAEARFVVRSGAYRIALRRSGTLDPEIALQDWSASPSSGQVFGFWSNRYLRSDPRKSSSETPALLQRDIDLSKQLPSTMIQDART